jgi:hypothetical protein
MMRTDPEPDHHIAFANIEHTPSAADPSGDQSSRSRDGFKVEARVKRIVAPESIKASGNSLAVFR